MIFASNNKGKIKEIKEIFKDYQIISLKEANVDIDILENGKTFYDNALVKAKTIYELTGIPTIADDSGLIIEEFKDWPGVNTKRISNNQDNDEHERNILLIDKTKSLKNKNIKAVCVLVYYDRDNIISAEGVMKGKITDKEYPGNGFGFDKIFMLPCGKTVSMLSDKEKNAISHRSMASKILKEKLDKIKTRN